ncbi:acyltransferase family protein [Caulobacter sp. KR2-114]|uniref:acyltransferase family protein n=1 Tax=Caulobacter sp. KR2-114 TaxID=3400912 RepID=UPI003BFFB3BD
MKTSVSIQYLRAIAAVGVAAYHACQWRSGGFEVGRAGVDLFFVISGFIMWRITAGRETALASFVWRRFTRVAPTYWVLTLAMAGVALAWPNFLPNVHAGWRHVLLSMAFITHLDPKGLPFPVLPAGWTLNYEAVFYLLFAAGLWLREQSRILFVTAALTAVAVLGLLDPPLYALGANAMMLEFAAGLWLGRLAQRGLLPGPKVGMLLAAGGVIAFAASNTAGVADSLLRPLLWGLPAAALVLGALALEAAGRTPRLPWLKRLGDASYSIYLGHAPATAVVAHTLGTDRPWLFIPAALAASILAGLAGRALLEKPLLRLLRGAAGAGELRPVPGWQAAPGTD